MTFNLISPIRTLLLSIKRINLPKILRMKNSYLFMLPRRHLSLESTSKTQEYSFNEPSFSLINYPIIDRGYLKKEFVCALLVKSFGCSEEQAANVFTKYPELKEMNIRSFFEMLLFYKESRINEQILLNNVWLLLQSPPSARRNFKLLLKLGINEDTIQLMKLSQISLKKVSEKWIISETLDGFAYTNRLEFLKKRLGCSVAQILENPILLTADFNKVKQKLQLLLNHGFEIQEITQCLKVFKMTITKLSYRLNKAKSANIGPLKMWRLFCSDEEFEKLLIKWENVGEGLSIKIETRSYLKERLQCSDDYIDWLFYKCPRLLVIKVQKLKVIIDFLYSINFTAEHVCLTPRVLQMDVNLLKRRYLRLSELGHKPQHLSQLINSQEYQKLITKLK